MYRSLTNCAVMVLLILGSLVAGVHGQDSTGRTGVLTVPWDEFKGLLNLDEDLITVPLDTFQKLLAQTGVKTAPPHTLHGGNVVLTREEFTNLVNQMKPPVETAEALPFDYLVTRSIYSGQVRDGGTTFSGRFIVHVLKKDAYLKVPLLPLSIALEDVTINGEQTLVIGEGGHHNIILSEAGEYEISTSFSIRSSIGSGPNKIDLAILPTPITLLKLEIPLADIEVEIPQAQRLLTSSKRDMTSVTATVGQGRSISVRWHKKTTPAEKIPPKLYAELNHLVSIDDDVFRISTDINLKVLYSEISEVRLAIPSDMNVLSVTGEGVGDWQETLNVDQRSISIPFTYGMKGVVFLTVTSEAALTESGLANAFSGIRVLESVRETGFVGTELNTSAEVLVAESNGLESVAVQKLPHQLINKSTKPLMLGFKYLKHPFNLVLDIKKHKKVAVPVATINSANAVTLFTEDGKIVHRLVYHVRNNAKQFLEVQLPSNADVWSVFVDGKPVESSVNSEAKLLIPLIRSQSTNDRLGTFPVEMIYCLVADRFSWFDDRSSALPAVDLMISQLMWSVYLPNDYSYHHFTSSLEIEEMIRGINILSGDERRYNEEAMKEISGLDRDDSGLPLSGKLKQAYEGKVLSSSFRNIPMKDEQLVGQLNAEIEFGGRLEGLANQNAPQVAISGGNATGVLPIQIQVPVSGQVYRFAKTIIKPEDLLSVEVVYSRSWVSASLKWLVLLAILFVLYLVRQRLAKLWQWSMIGREALVGFFERNRSTIQKVARSAMTPVVLFGLLVVSWPVSTILALLFLFLFWVSAAYQLLEYRRKRALAKTNMSSRSKE